jgi:hypothetical protein
MRTLIVALLLMPTLTLGQFVEQFNDVNLLDNPTWQGRLNYFFINGSAQLQTADMGTSDTAFLFTPFNPDLSDTITWEWYWSLDFAPSNNNYAVVFLMSSGSTPFQGHGVYLRLGVNGSQDALQLYRYHNGVHTLLGSSWQTFPDHPDIVIRMNHYPNGLWELTCREYQQVHFDSSLMVLDTATQVGSFFGIWCKYTVSNADGFRFDDFFIDSTIADTIAPSLLTCAPVNNQNLRLQFSEPLDVISATETDNYSIDPELGNPTIAAIDSVDSSVIYLAFDTSFADGATYALYVDGIQDQAGNSAYDSAQFQFFHLSLPTFRSLVINEFMADPSPPIGLPEAEYVELFNPSGSYQSLEGLTLSDATTSQPLPPLIMAPGAYTIVCARQDSFELSAHGSVCALASLPSINNSGDELTLSRGDEIIDQLRFDLGWYGDGGASNGGVSLEQVNPTKRCSGETNWRASSSTKGGTPGTQNTNWSEQADLIAPKVLTWGAQSQSLQLCFDEILDSVRLVNCQFLGESMAVTRQIFDYNCLDLILDAPLLPGQSYTLVLGGFGDCDDNLADDTTFRVGVGVEPLPFDLVFNEVYHIPIEASPLSVSEFVELCNRSDRVIRTEGLRFADRLSDAVLSEGVLFPGQFLLLTSSASSSIAAPGALVMGLSGFPSLNNDGDHLRLFSNLTLIDEVDYQNSWHTNESRAKGGWSLERVRINDLCGTGNNWATSTSPAHGSPGGMNSVQRADDVPGPRIESVQVHHVDSALLTLNQRIDTSHHTQFLLDGTAVWAKSNSTFEWSLSWNGPLERGTTHSWQVLDAKDCTASPIDLPAFEAYWCDSGEVVVNELLFNPRSGGSDFLELRNQAAYPIDLTGWTMCAEDDLRDLIWSTPLHSGDLQPQELMVVLEDSSDIALRYPFHDAKRFLHGDLPAYNDREGVVVICDPTQTVIERFAYDASMHFELITDPEGVSLERIQPHMPASQRDNWHSASESVGFASPGLPNSQYLAGGASKSHVSLTSNHISPDGDGHEDLLGIQIKPFSNGFAANVAIYGTSGMLERSVATAFPLGLDNTLFWDGLSDWGRVSKPGLYVVWVDLYNTNGDRSQYRIPVVVATRP